MLEMPTPQREAFARSIAERVRTEPERPIYVSYEPGDSTHYDLLFVNMDHATRLQCDGRHRIPDHVAEHLEAIGLHTAHLIPRDRWTMADGAVGFRAMTVDLTPGHYTDPIYVQEKWQRTTLGSAIIVAELLCMITGAYPDRLRASYPQVFGDPE